MKEEMQKFLDNYWTSGRDNDIINEFINNFFNQYQPERSKREDLYNNGEERRLEEIHFPCE